MEDRIRRSLMRFILPVLLATATVAATAQIPHAQVSGVVLESAGGAPVAGAGVLFGFAAPETLVTDGEGRFGPHVTAVAAGPPRATASLRVVPNPVSGAARAELRLPADKAAAAAELRVFDLRGRELPPSRTPKPGGVYLARVTMADGGTVDARFTALDGWRELDLALLPVDAAKSLTVPVRVEDAGGAALIDTLLTVDDPADLTDLVLLADGGAPLPLDQWTYLQLDDSRAARCFGLASGDLDGDGDLDVAAGRYVYLNPGGDMSAPWPRADLGAGLDATLIVDVDGDDRGDLIVLDLPRVLWYEADDAAATSWSVAAEISDAMPAPDFNPGTQGYGLAQIVPGGRPEILLAAGDGTHALVIPADPAADPWTDLHLEPLNLGNGLACGDLDGDGDDDLVCSDVTTDPGTGMLVYENPGGGGGWSGALIGQTLHEHADRMAVADVNGDGRPDVVVSTEEYPDTPGFGESYLHWFQAPADPFTGAWTRHDVAMTESLNSMSARDLDGDGDVDVIAGEIFGDDRLLIFENDGAGNFTMHVTDTGHEHHLGCHTADLDGDGDLDVVSIAWENVGSPPEYAYLHLWRNDAIGP